MARQNILLLPAYQHEAPLELQKQGCLLRQDQYVGST
jgi:hypothetical protein